MILRSGFYPGAKQFFFITISQKLKLRAHHVKTYGEIFFFHLSRKYLLQVFDFSTPSHGEYTDSLFFIICGSKIWQALDVIQMKMRKKNIDDILGEAASDNFLSKISNARACVNNSKPIGSFPIDLYAGRISAIPFKFSAAYGQ